MNAVLMVAPQQHRDGSHDFDFLFGKWMLHNRRLKERLADCQEWAEFASTNDCQPLPGGFGNQDVYRTDYWPDFTGMTLRFYNPASQLWSIYWMDSRNAPGVLQAPVVGSFSDNVGVFQGEDTFNGKPRRVRFIWSVISQHQLHWEQAFSPDNGANWETNWVMEFTRAST
jgi:hypothetical protein